MGLHLDSYGVELREAFTLSLRVCHSFYLMDQQQEAFTYYHLQYKYT